MPSPIGSINAMGPPEPELEPIPPCALACRHFRTLLGKNGRLKQREWSTTCCCPWCPLAALCELVLPLAVLALLWWAKSQCRHEGQCLLPVLSGWDGHMPPMNITTVCEEGLPLGEDRFGRSLSGTSKCNA